MLYSKHFVEWNYWGLFLAVVLCVHVDKSWCQPLITSQPSVPNVGDTVTLHFNSGSKINMVNWYRGDKALREKNIVTFNPSNPSGLTNGPEFNKRMKVLDDGSLQISSVTAADGGNYTLELSRQNYYSVIDIYTHFLTVNSPPNRNPATQRNTENVSPTTNSPPDAHATNSQTRGSNNPLLGIIIGSLVAVILVVVFSVLLWHKRVCNKSKESPVDENDKPTAVASSSENNELSEQKNNLNRRLPSVPVHFPVYQNENNNSIINNEEHPYTDLNYAYLSSSYHDLQSS